MPTEIIGSEKRDLRRAPQFPRNAFRSVLVPFLAPFASPTDEDFFFSFLFFLFSASLCLVNRTRGVRRRLPIPTAAGEKRIHQTKPPGSEWSFRKGNKKALISSSSSFSFISLDPEEVEEEGEMPMPKMTR